ncbi:hypothetical protein SAMN05421541_116171 [Actinoplanes philippinensis]|uniref:Uncharacterized protein n=1 Tax=Actinoplanes philippinensis TaxID=35752 RepID=A0A1I2KFR7_9ACTN|nr:hypothetical protein [Actinoplanes philippinensis]SFF65293.1 hypothetical protein SAMN05421541_116171 [Actinoplanes philippinensis]
MERRPNERQAAGTHGNERGWGDRMHGGAVTGGTRDDHIWVNVSLLGTGMTARLSPDQADDLARQLHLWAEQVRRTRT